MDKGLNQISTGILITLCFGCHRVFCMHFLQILACRSLSYLNYSNYPRHRGAAIFMKLRRVRLCYLTKHNLTLPGKKSEKHGVHLLIIFGTALRLRNHYLLFLDTSTCSSLTYLIYADPARHRGAATS